VTTTFQTPGAAAAQQAADDLKKSVENIPTEWRTTFYSDYVYTNTAGGGASANAAEHAQAAAGHADGGWVSGPGGPRDDKVAANLSPGEFVVNAASAGRNRGLLEAINGGRLGFADGGAVPAAAAGASADVAVSSAVSVPDVAAIKAAWDAIAGAVRDAWAAVIQPALAALSAQNAATSAETLALRDVSVVPAWDGIGASISTTTSGIILPTYDTLNAGTTNTAATWQALLDATVNPVWAGITNTIQVSWAGTVSPVYDQLNAGTQNAGVQFENLAATTDSAWSRIGSTISGVYSGSIVPAWDGVQGFANATGDFFGGIQSGMSGAKDQIVKDLGEITDEINKFFDMVAGKTASTPGATASATVTPTFADGGLITMGTGPRTDDVHIRASKGEYVVNAASTAKHRDVLDQINYGGAFADGGLVGEKISGNLQDKIQTGAYAAIDAVVTKTLAAIPAAFAGFSGPAPIGARGAFLDAILSKQGTAYVWGAAGPDVFDCSGLMSWGLEQAGVGKGRLTAEGFNSGWPHIPNPKPGDMVTFDTGRLPGQAGHIGAVLDPGAGTMMHTDGAGPARISPYRSRSGLLGFVDPIGGEYQTAPVSQENGDPPSAGAVAAIIKKIKAGGTGTPTASGNVSYNATAGVEQWRDEVLFSLAFLGESPGLANNVLNQIRTESSGNPNAINLTDSNAMRGTPSKGLVQVIDPTFRSYAVAPYNTNIWDPISNLIAGENYARHQYGSIAAGMRGVAYDQGGWLQPGWSSTYNGLGSPEAILTGPQWAAAQSAIQHTVNNTNSSNTGQQGGIQIGTMYAYQPGQATAELDYALARCR
jgi:SLT domain-containing protein